VVGEPLVIEFHQDDRDPVVRRMVAMVNNSQGWINFTPGLDVDVPPPERSLLTQLFTARGPDVPLATWAPADGRREPSTIGIQHGQGPRVIERLDEAGLPLPIGWRKLQDHPKRGLVCVVPSTSSAADLDQALAWLLRAGGVLCPVPRTGEWRALCYRVV
jgi:hypothetical protein